MSRKPRKLTATGIYHVIIRGIDHQNIFYDDEDRLFFIGRLKRYTKQLDISVYSYCLMDNHVHLLIGNANPNLALLMKKIGVSYVYYFNKKYKRSGQLLQDRYKSECVEDDEYLKVLIRYILKNPDKAGICTFNKYKWNSFNSYCNRNDFVNTSYIMDIFGGAIQFNKFMSLREKDICMEYENKKLISDDMLIDFIKSQFFIKNPRNICKYNFDKQKKIINEIKLYGIPVRQISRITGICQRLVSSF